MADRKTRNRSRRARRLAAGISAGAVALAMALPAAAFGQEITVSRLGNRNLVVAADVSTNKAHNAAIEAAIQAAKNSADSDQYARQEQSQPNILNSEVKAPADNSLRIEDVSSDASNTVRSGDASAVGNLTNVDVYNPQKASADVRGDAISKVYTGDSQARAAGDVASIGGDSAVVNKQETGNGGGSYADSSGRSGSGGDARSSADSGSGGRGGDVLARNRGGAGGSVYGDDGFGGFGGSATGSAENGGPGGPSGPATANATGGNSGPVGSTAGSGNGGASGPNYADGSATGGDSSSLGHDVASGNTGNNINTAVLEGGTAVNEFGALVATEGIANSTGGAATNTGNATSGATVSPTQAASPYVTVGQANAPTLSGAQTLGSTQSGETGSLTGSQASDQANYQTTPTGTAAVVDADNIDNRNVLVGVNFSSNRAANGAAELSAQVAKNNSDSDQTAKQDQFQLNKLNSKVYAPASNSAKIEDVSSDASNYVSAGDAKSLGNATNVEIGGGQYASADVRGNAVSVIASGDSQAAAYGDVKSVGGDAKVINVQETGRGGTTSADAYGRSGSGGDASAWADSGRGGSGGDVRARNSGGDGGYVVGSAGIGGDGGNAEGNAAGGGAGGASGAAGASGYGGASGAVTSAATSGDGGDSGANSGNGTSVGGASDATGHLVRSGNTGGNTGTAAVVGGTAVNRSAVTVGTTGTANATGGAATNGGSALSNATVLPSQVANPTVSVDQANTPSLTASQALTNAQTGLTGHQANTQGNFQVNDQNP